jgi:hypothetical protein
MIRFNIPVAEFEQLDESMHFRGWKIWLGNFSGTIESTLLLHKTAADFGSALCVSIRRGCYG